jgi:hypothetical protein
MGSPDCLPRAVSRSRRLFSKRRESRGGCRSGSREARVRCAPLQGSLGPIHPGRMQILKVNKGKRGRQAVSRAGRAFA